MIFTCPWGEKKGMSLQAHERCAVTVGYSVGSLTREQMSGLVLCAVNQPAISGTCGEVWQARLQVKVACFRRLCPRIRNFFFHHCHSRLSCFPACVPHVCARPQYPANLEWSWHFRRGTKAVTPVACLSWAKSPHPESHFLPSVKFVSLFWNSATSLTHTHIKFPSPDCKQQLATFWTWKNNTVLI